MNKRICFIARLLLQKKIAYRQVPKRQSDVPIGNLTVSDFFCNILRPLYAFVFKK